MTDQSRSVPLTVVGPPADPPPRPSSRGRTALIAASLAPALAAGLALGLVRRLVRRLGGGRVRRSLWFGPPLPTLPVKALAERRLGVTAFTMVHSRTHLRGRFDHDLAAWKDVPVLGPVLGRLAPLLAFLWICATIDRIHLFHDRGVLPLFRPWRVNPWELRLYRVIGMQIVAWCYGADVRVRAETVVRGPYHCCMECPAPGHHCICRQEDAERNREIVRRAADIVASMGDMRANLPGSVTDLFFWPVDLDRDGGERYAPAVPEWDGRRPLRLVHAPNHRFFKGTDRIIAAVERLQAEGRPVELILVEGRPNAEALRLYREADAIVDQCIAGFHGYTAQEAMALGKPVFAWIREPELDLLAPDECPILPLPPDDVAGGLRRLLDDPASVERVGRAGRTYIERHHTPAAFAGRLARAYAERGLGP